MTAVQLFLTVAASLCGLSAAVFCILYARTRKGKRRLWWESTTGRNLMAMGASLALLAAGTVTRRLIPLHEVGNVILAVAYLLVAAVMVWRTVMMWRANHPRYVPGAPAMPAHLGESRPWHMPTPGSIIEPPRNT